MSEDVKNYKTGGKVGGGSAPKSPPKPSPSPAPAPKPPAPSISPERKVIAEVTKNIVTQTKAKEEARATQLAQVKARDEGKRGIARDAAIRQATQQAAKEDLRRISTSQTVNIPPRTTNIATNKPGGKIPPRYRGPGDPAPNLPVPQIDPVFDGPYIPPRIPTDPTGDTPPNDNGYFYSPYVSPTPSPVLIPGRDALNFATSGVIDSLTSFIFEDLAGTEIISLMKRDTIDGIDPNYSIISNISDVRMSVDPTSLLSKKTKTDSYFDVFGIQLLDKIPGNEYLAKNSIHDFYYIASNGDLVIELDNLGVDERIDVEIATNGTIKELDN